MSLEFDKEINALLRDEARRGRTAASARPDGRETEPRADGDGSVLATTTSAAHLDADEQNAYAENALPAATRHAYAAHLADCDVCRRSVTQLALAAGIPAALAERETVRQERVLPNVATWHERLGALLAPRAWRYAVPALVLLLVSAVTLIVLTWGSRRDGSIAQLNKEQQAARPSIAKTEEAHHAPQNSNAVAAPIGQREGGNAPNANAPMTSDQLAADSAGEKEAQQLAGGVALKDPAAPAASTGAAAPPPPAAAADVAAPAPTPMPSEADIVADDPAAKPKIAESVAEQARIENRQTQNENYQRDDANMAARRNEPKRSGPSRSNNIEQIPQQSARSANYGGPRQKSADNKKDENVVVVAPAATPSPVPPAAPATAERLERQRNADKEDDESIASTGSVKRKNTRAPEPAGETRNVAGRKFRRRDGAWIDTAYNSTQAVTVVRRNSEQYRALIADEPGLRRIADSLGGEVVVVWKGRNYRIK